MDQHSHSRNIYRVLGLRAYEDVRTSSPSSSSTSTATTTMTTIDRNEQRYHRGEENERSSMGQSSRNLLYSLMLWEDSYRTVSIIVAFNVFFWISILLQIRGFAVVCSAAIIIILTCHTLERILLMGNRSSNNLISEEKIEQFRRIVRRVECAIKTLKGYRRTQPQKFCCITCMIAFGIWMIGHTLSGPAILYITFMCIFLGPMIFFKLPNRIFVVRESDNEIEEFLPAVTEDNLQVLRRAGECGDPSPHNTVSENQGLFNEEELLFLRMPSYDEGSTDGVELSELELSTGDNEADAIRLNSDHFEGGSSDEEAEFEPESKEIPGHSEDSDSDFEFIDKHELDDFSNV